MRRKPRPSREPRKPPERYYDKPVLDRIPAMYKRMFVDQLLRTLRADIPARREDRNPFSKLAKERRLRDELARVKRENAQLRQFLSGRNPIPNDPQGGGPVYRAEGPHRIRIGDLLWDTSLERGPQVMVVDCTEADWAAGYCGHLEIKPGRPFLIKLPDGGLVKVHASGAFQVERPDRTKPVYGPPLIRGFNRFIHASDLLGEFVEDLGRLGVPQDALLQLPVEVFINWLVYEAAREDGDDVMALPVPEDHPAVQRLATPALTHEGS